MVDLRVNRLGNALPERLILADNVIDIWWLDLDAPTHNAQVYRPLLDPLETDRMQRLRTEDLQRRFAIRRGVLRLLLSAYLDCPTSAVVYSANRCGKPELIPPAATPNLYFNLSHSDGCAVYAVTRVGQVGVDVERAVGIPNMRRVAQSVFTSAEQAALSGLPDDQQVTAFYNGWTRKEAVVKALGQGMSYGLNTFSVSMKPGEPARVLAAHDESVLTLTLLSVPLPAPYIAACAFQVERT